MGDLSHKTVEQVTFTDNVLNQGQDTAHFITVNQETEDSRLSCPVKSKGKTIHLDVLRVHVALIRRED